VEAKMNKKLAIKHDLSPIENADLSPKTKAQYIKAIKNYLNTGHKLGDAKALSEYALGLPKSSKAFLKAGMHLMIAGLENDLKANATIENLQDVQVALLRLEALQDAIHVEKPKGNKAHIWLSPMQIKELMATCDDSIQGQRDWLLLGILVGAGLRCQEAVNLQFDNLIELPIPKNGMRTCIQVIGKGDKSRTIPIKPLLASRIQEWKAIVGDGRILRSLGRKMILGERLAPQAVFQIVRKHGAMIGFPRLAPHDLRRSFAQVGLDAKASIKQISLVLGHSNSAITDGYLNNELDLINPISDFIPLD
jgi:integrase